MDYREHLANVRRRPGAYLMTSTPSFDEVVAYVAGVDAGTSNLLLSGWYEFLVLRVARAR